MNEFAYQDLLPLGQDTTPYRLLTKAGVTSFEAGGHSFLAIEPAALTELTVYPNYHSVAFASEDVPPITLTAIESTRQIEGVEAVIPVLPRLIQAELRNGRFSNYLSVYGIDYALLP